MEHRANVSSDFLAAERTFLGWIRTGLALMGFGFVVARFGLFVQELQFAYPDLPVRGPSRSVPLGTVLVILGVIVTLGSAWNHVRLMQEFRREGESVDRTSTLGIVVSLALAGVGIAMAVTLFTYSEPGQPHSETRGSKTMKSDNGI